MTDGSSFSVVNLLITLQLYQRTGLKVLVENMFTNYNAVTQ